MSHFSVLVIGPDVEDQLQPYHEFECTGTDDKYVQDIDQTQELLDEFNSNTETRLRLADGTLASPYDDQFYRDPTEEDQKIIGSKVLAGSGWGGGISWHSKDWNDGKGYRPKVKFTPEGAEQVEVPTPETRTFADWLDGYYGRKVVPFGEQPDLTGDHKYGYALVDSDGNITKIVDRTNPNKRWDWWVPGGRWSGFLKLKQGAHGELGRKGLMGSCANDGPGRADQALKGAIDFEGMRAEAGAKASAKWWHARAALVAAGAPLTWITWEHMREVTHKGNIEAAREAYNAQPSVKAIKDASEDKFWVEPDQYLVPHEVYVQQARDRSTVPYALVKDGQWIGKGEMGWFGMSDDKVSQDEWNRKVNEMLDALPDDTLITVVDCHI